MAQSEAEREGAALAPGAAASSGFGPIGGEAEHLAHPGLDMSGSRAGADDRPPTAIDRSHNRDTLSSEAMTEMLRDLQDSLSAAEARVSGLESAHGRISHEARELAIGVAALGDTLSRRVRALEAGGRGPRAAPPSAAAIPLPPARRATLRRPEPVLRWTVILAVALGFVLAGFWLLGAEAVDRAAPPPPRPIAIVQAAPTRAPATSTAAASVVHPWGAKSASEHRRPASD